MFAHCSMSGIHFSVSLQKYKLDQIHSRPKITFNFMFYKTELKQPDISNVVKILTLSS